MRQLNPWLSMEPLVESPPVHVSRDWFLVAVVAGTTVAEVVVRDGMVPWRPVAILVGFGLALTMLWRRTRPLAMVGFGFGAFLVVDLDSVILSAEPFSLYAGGFVLVLVYSLFRWGTARQAAIGSLIVLVEWSLATAVDFSVADAIGGMAVLMFVAALGVATRYRRIVRTQQLERVRFNERETLARELHDTVAHHVSAIAIQAQAGQVVAKTNDLDGVAAALGVIEEQASRTLAEMRTMVGVLRGTDVTPSVSTPGGIADIERLSTAKGSSGPRVEVEYCGDVNDLRPSVQAALYRVGWLALPR